MDLLISTRPKIGTKLFAVVMINNDGHLYSRYQGLNLVGELADEDVVVVNSHIRNDIHREVILLLRVVETMYLDDILVGSKCLHHFRLQLLSSLSDNIECPTKVQIRITNLDKKQVRLYQRLLE